MQLFLSMEATPLTVKPVYTKHPLDQLLCSEQTGVRSIQVKSTILPTLEIYLFKFSLFRILVYSGFGLDRFHCIYYSIVYIVIRLYFALYPIRNNYQKILRNLQIKKRNPLQLYELCNVMPKVCQFFKSTLYIHIRTYFL